nr:MAG TPA: baseplate assembly protein V [Caudoviricetes sp.]
MQDILKQGEINSIDVKNGKARVIFPDRDNKISDWLNILVPFSESHSDNYNLVIGQTVIVLSLPDMMEQGYILGCPMRPSGISEGEVKRTFSDGGFYSYKDGVLTLSPITKVVINADMEIKKTLTVDGDTTFKSNTETKGTAKLDGINLNKHTHKGVKAGGDNTGGPS